MKKSLVMLFTLLLLSGCTHAVQGEDLSNEVQISIEPGENWTRTMWIAFIPVKKAPQLAVWIETEDGTYVSTITVTQSASKQKWAGNPKNGRPESLPVWIHAKKASGAGVDETTSATPQNGITSGTTASALIPGQKYRILVEVNASFDYNESWPENAKEEDKNYSGVNGQPSLIYEAYFTAGEKGTVSLEPVGQGSIDGSNGDITRNLEGLTTALSIIKSAEFFLR